MSSGCVSAAAGDAAAARRIHCSHLKTIEASESTATEQVMTRTAELKKDRRTQTPTAAQLHQPKSSAAKSLVRGALTITRLLEDADSLTSLINEPEV